MILERCAGILIPLFSLRTADDLGRGDLGGLVPMGELAAAMGHRLLQLLPIDETAPGQASPYSAESVLAIDPSYFAARHMVGISEESLAAARREISAGNPESPDLKRLREFKEQFLTESFNHFELEGNQETRRAFETFTRLNHAWLEDYALFRAFKDEFKGLPWNEWPLNVKLHRSEAIADAARSLEPTIRRYKFGQFVLDQQSQQAREQLRQRGVFLGGDLAFSPAHDSAEVWAHQEWFDLSRAVGAPPDAFSATGQRWDLPMPDWAKMRASGFALIRMRLRCARARFDFVRIDHVVGLFRTYGYPTAIDAEGAFDPTSEAAQRAQGEEILRIILEEAGPMQVIAEDLGVVPPFVRKTLVRLGIPGYKVAYWEIKGEGAEAYIVNPADYPELALATTGTHDTETLSGWWSTIAEDERRRFVQGFGLDPETAHRTVLDDATRDQILNKIYASPARLVIVPIQDLFGWKDRINVPGAITATNWRWRLPFDPASAIEDPALRVRIEELRAMTEQTGRYTGQRIELIV